MDPLLVTVFAVALVAELALGVLLVVSVLRPDARVWPPPGRPSWQYYLVWTLLDVSAVGIVAVGILDWNSSALAHPARIPIGVAVGGAGGLFALWGIRTLGWHQAFGLEGTLVERGPYRVSRNPQYVGDIALLLGWGLLCNSLLTWVLCALGMAWFAVTPFAEEPWLREVYGPPYDAYRRRVPRFLGRPRGDGGSRAEARREIG